MHHAPTFLVGAERSGMTLFRLLVDSHPDVTCIEGLDYVIGAVGSDGSRPDLDEYEAYLATETVFSTSGFVVDLSLGTFDAVVDDFLSQRLDASGKTHVAALLHTGYATALELWPDARFVHVVRDPRAVALSAKPLEWGGNVYVAVQKWIDEELEWESLIDVLPAERWIEIKFDELVTDHEATLGSVCSFLGVDYTDEMMSYAAETDYERPDPAKATEWRDHITDREIQLVEARVGDLLVRRGFEPSGLPPIEVTDRDRTLIRSEVRLKKWSHKLSSHGWVAVAELITRKLGIDAWHRPMKQRMNADERAGRKRSWRQDGREFALAPAKRHG